MDNRPIQILLIEDNPGDAELLRVMLDQVTGTPFALTWADRLQKGLERLAKGGVDLVLLDLSLPDSHGLDTFRRVKAQASAVPGQTHKRSPTMPSRPMRKRASTSSCTSFPTQW